jgi:hypothetical protein
VHRVARRDDGEPGEHENAPENIEHRSFVHFFL